MTRFRTKKAMTPRGRTPGTTVRIVAQSRCTSQDRRPATSSRVFPSTPVWLVPGLVDVDVGRDGSAGRVESENPVAGEAGLGVLRLGSEVARVARRDRGGEIDGRKENAPVAIEIGEEWDVGDQHDAHLPLALRPAAQFARDRHDEAAGALDRDSAGLGQTGDVDMVRRSHGDAFECGQPELRGVLRGGRRDEATDGRERQEDLLTTSHDALLSAKSPDPVEEGSSSSLTRRSFASRRGILCGYAVVGSLGPRS